MISIISTNFRMSGGLLNHLDTYAFLKEYKPKFYYMDMNEKPLWQLLLETGRNYNIKDPIKLSYYVEDDIIITDFRGLIVLNHEKVKLRCNRLVIMDCMELTFNLFRLSGAKDWFFWFDRFSYLESIYNYFQYNFFYELLFLMPPCDYGEFVKRYPDIPSQIFYKKINVPILMSHRNIPLFQQNKYIYRRKEEKKYLDQFGRTIFEFIILGKEVEVNFKDPDPFTYNDGISDYLKYYDIKFENGKAITKPEKLIQRMQDDGKYLRSELLL